MPEVGFEIIDHASLTDVGARRSHNQDALAVILANSEEAWQERGHLFLVADGMGAHAVGELASKRAADLIPHAYLKHARQGAPTALLKAFQEANTAIHHQGQQNPEFEGMGTTSTALVLRREGAWTAHVGDSRVYRIRSGYIEQLSFDHSLQWELARRQGVDPEQIEGIPTNVIVRSLGPEPAVQVDIEGPHEVWPGDIYVLCSDGLSGLVNDREIGAIATVLPAQEAVQLLVDLANLRGGPDNITAVLARLPGESPPSSSELPLISPTRASRWSLSQTISWPGVAMGAGTTLAIVALALVIAGLHQWAVGTFLAAGVVLISGLLGLRHTLRQQEIREAQADQHGPPQVYHRVRCHVDASMVDRLVQLHTALQAKVRDNGYQVSWADVEKRVQAATAMRRSNDMAGAFREYCRAIAKLTEALRQHRSRGETFRPIW